MASLHQLFKILSSPAATPTAASRFSPSKTSSSLLSNKPHRTPAPTTQPFVFPTKYASPALRDYLAHPDSQRGHDFAESHDLSPREVAAVLGGRVEKVFERNGEWAAVLHFDRSCDARLNPLQHNPLSTKTNRSKLKANRCAVSSSLVLLAAFGLPAVAPAPLASGDRTREVRCHGLLPPQWRASLYGQHAAHAGYVPAFSDVARASLKTSTTHLKSTVSLVSAPALSVTL